MSGTISRHRMELREVRDRHRGIPKALVLRIGEHRILGMSAEAGFWQLVSLPSMMVAVFGALGFLSGVIGATDIGRIKADVLRVAGDLLDPTTVSQDVAPLVDHLLSKGHAELVSIGFIVSLWSGSSATSSFLSTITVVYGMRGVRSALRSRAVALGLYVGSVAAGIVLLPALAIGPSIVSSVAPSAVRGDVNLIASTIYWPSIMVISVIAIATMYRLCLPRRVPWIEHLPGGVFAMLIWLVSSVVIRTYMTEKLRESPFYGALAAPLAGLLFFYVTALAILMGAELNAVLRERHQQRRAPAAGGAGQPSEESDHSSLDEH